MLKRFITWLRALFARHVVQPEPLLGRPRWRQWHRYLMPPPGKGSRKERRETARRMFRRMRNVIKESRP